MNAQKIFKQNSTQSFPSYMKASLMLQFNYCWTCKAAHHLTCGCSLKSDKTERKNNTAIPVNGGAIRKKMKNLTVRQHTSKETAMCQLNSDTPRQKTQYINDAHSSSVENMHNPRKQPAVMNCLMKKSACSLALCLFSVLLCQSVYLKKEIWGIQLSVEIKPP